MNAFDPNVVELIGGLEVIRQGKVSMIVLMIYVGCKCEVGATWTWFKLPVAHLLLTVQRQISLGFSFCLTVCRDLFFKLVYRRMLSSLPIVWRLFSHWLFLICLKACAWLPIFKNAWVIPVDTRKKSQIHFFIKYLSFMIFCYTGKYVNKSVNVQIIRAVRQWNQCFEWKWITVMFVSQWCSLTN